MERNILISVIVPVYKVEDYLSKCVDSILGQTYGDLEVILVDDGSPDGCGRICDDYAEKDPRVKVIHKSNGGLSSARNAGIDIASGDYLAFADSDDYLEPDAYEAMLSAALENQVRLVCAGRYDETDGEMTPGLCPVRDEVISGAELVRRIFTWDHIDSAAWDKLYARELFRQIRYPVGRIVEDVPTTYRIALDAGTAAMLAKPVYHYIHRENSITTTAVISEKSFHFTEHAALVYRDICARLPELEPEARYLRVRSVLHTLILLELSDGQTKARFAEKYAQLRADLRHELRFLLGCPLFDRQTKLTAVLICAGVYPILRRVYHLLKYRGKEPV